jgi:hypothetical protein
MASDKQVVLDRLRKQRLAESIVNQEIILSEWVGAINELMAQLRGWLADAEREGLFKIIPEAIDREEHLLGHYRTQALKLVSPAGEVIKIVPKARHVLGSYGRVDLECPPRTTILVRPEIGRWQVTKLVPEQRGWMPENLTEETFWQAINDLLS